MDKIDRHQNKLNLSWDKMTVLDYRLSRTTSVGLFHAKDDAGNSAVLQKLAQDNNAESLQAPYFKPFWSHCW